MIQLILLVIGIVYLVRRPKYARASAEDYPQVDAATFAEWRRLELKSIDVFLWATWGTFVLSIIAAFGLGFSLSVLNPGMQSANADLMPMVIVLAIVMVIVFFSGLVVSAVLGSRAARLRKQHGIVLGKSPERTA